LKPGEGLVKKEQERRLSSIKIRHVSLSENLRQRERGGEGGNSEHKGTVKKVKVLLVTSLTHKSLFVEWEWLLLRHLLKEEAGVLLEESGSKAKREERRGLLN